MSAQTPPPFPSSRLPVIRLFLFVGVLAACTLVACSPGPAPTCSSGPAPTFSPTPSTACGTYDALVAASDYMSREIGTITLGGSKTFEGFVDLGTDPALESSAGRFFWIAQ